MVDQYIPERSHAVHLDIREEGAVEDLVNDGRAPVVLGRKTGLRTNEPLETVLCFIPPNQTIPITPGEALRITSIEQKLLREKLA